jgi:glycosyltransferase involved in cell wall biosynthesis
LAAQNGKGPLSRIRIAFFRVAYFIDEYKKWSWYASRAAVRVGGKYRAKLVFSSSPPLSVLLAGTRAAKRLGVPHIADLRDPWTDAFEDETLLRAELWLLRLFERHVMHSAAAVTSAGAYVAERLARRYPGIREKVHVVRNGYDGELREAPPSTRGRLTILFAGELYSGRDPFPLLEALERILVRPAVDASRISVTFMGAVREYKGQSLSTWLRGKRCAEVVAIVPRQPQYVVDQAVNDSTVLLNLYQEQPLCVPAKTYEHLASGRENLLLCEQDSETAAVVAGIRGVNQVDPHSPTALESTLLDLYRRHAVEARLTAPAAKDVIQFSRSCANERFWEVMCSLAEVTTEIPANSSNRRSPGDAGSSPENISR